MLLCVRCYIAAVRYGIQLEKMVRRAQAVVYLFVTHTIFSGISSYSTTTNHLSNPSLWDISSNRAQTNAATRFVFCDKWNGYFGEMQSKKIFFSFFSKLIDDDDNHNNCIEFHCDDCLFWHAKRSSHSPWSISIKYMREKNAFLFFRFRNRIGGRCHIRYTLHKHIHKHSLKRKKKNEKTN